MAFAEGIYRTVDNLKNFLIRYKQIVYVCVLKLSQKTLRVKLRKVTGVDVPVHDPLQSQRDVNLLEAAPSKYQPP